MGPLFRLRQIQRHGRAGSLLGVALALAGCSEYSEISEKQPLLSGPPGSGPLVAAEQAITRAAHETRAYLQTLGDCLDALASSSSELRRNPKDALARRDYNFALGRVFEIIKKAKLDIWTKPLSVPGSSIHLSDKCNLSHRGGGGDFERFAQERDF